ncbi:M57 family metalloprotease [Viridibacillus sp. NPDC096237]|uniref:M57 family metalloprotease n=1 Tax=Viridibacillus sp. NPDC096237 TaxID=3390721 RepID=UPI003D0587B8
MKKYLVFGIALFALILTSHPSSTYAYSYGDNPKWGSPNFTGNYKDLSFDYRTNFAVAISNWNATSTPLNFTQMADEYSEVAKIRANGSNLGNVEYNAIVYHYHASNYDRVTANYSYMKNYTADKNNGIMGHELGHVFGLDHVKTKTSIMCTSEDGRTATKPSADDIAGVNYLY